MIKNKVFSLLLASIMLLGLTFGCSRNITEEKPEEFSNGISENALKKISDNLYEITYTDDFDWSVTSNPTMGDATFGCSAVQNGALRGRNYDWYYNDSSICIVHASKTEKRKHASLGVCDLSFISDPDGNPDIDKIPFYMCDGINDAGVCIQVNILPQGENGEIGFEDNGKETIEGIFFIRYILDNAGSIDEVLEIIDNLNVNSYFGTKEFHWMISGPENDENKMIKNIVLEIFPDGPRVTEDFLNEKPVMTNFNIANFDGTLNSIGKGFGYERWQILNENFEQSSSVIGMFDLMEKVFYSKCYDLYGDRFWYSEFNGENLSVCYDPIELMSKIGTSKYNESMKNNGMILYSPDLFDGEPQINGDFSRAGIIAPVALRYYRNYIEQKYNDELMMTIYTSVYDLDNLTLDISVREAQDHLHFTLE